MLLRHRGCMSRPRVEESPTRRAPSAPCMMGTFALHLARGPFMFVSYRWMPTHSIDSGRTGILRDDAPSLSFHYRRFFAAHDT